MDIERFRPYWAATYWRAAFMLLAVMMFLFFGLAFAALLDHFEFLGFPLGLLLMGQGLVFFIIGFGFWFVHSQDHVDDYFGANEDL